MSEQHNSHSCMLLCLEINDLNGFLSEQRSINLHSPTKFGSPAHIVSRHSEKIQETKYKDEVFMEYMKERQKTIQTEGSKSTSILVDSKRFYEQWTLSGEVYEPAAKLLLLTVKWLYTIPSFLRMKRTEQCSLLCSNWREIFILTAAQYSFYFDEGIFFNFTFMSLMKYKVH